MNKIPEQSSTLTLFNLHNNPVLLAIQTFNDAFQEGETQYSMQLAIQGSEEEEVGQQLADELEVTRQQTEAHKEELRKLHEEQQSLDRDISSLKETMGRLRDELINFQQQQAAEAATAARVAAERTSQVREQEEANRRANARHEHGGMCGGSR
jgi:predicted RNase H-like nuclease (RuvC/YqgF family)